MPKSGPCVPPTAVTYGLVAGKDGKYYEVGEGKSSGKMIKLWDMEGGGGEERRGREKVVIIQRVKKHREDICRNYSNYSRMRMSMTVTKYPSDLNAPHSPSK